MPPQKQTFSDVTPIAQGSPQQTFSDVQPIGQSQPSTWQVLTQPTEKTDAEYKTYTGPAGVAGATVKGLDDVARGTEGAIEGLYNTVRHPIDAAKNIAKLPSQAAQVPGAIRDINATADAAYRYADVAQDTVSQAAGQALTALGTAGVTDAAVKAGPYIKPVAGALAKGYAKKLIPPEVGEAYRAVQRVRNTPKAPVPEVISPSRTMPGQNPPEVIQPPRPQPVTIPSQRGLALPPAPKGAELADLPPAGGKSVADTGEALGTIRPPQPKASYPGAPFPETPDPDLLRSQPLAKGPQPVPPRPSDSLGNIPVARGSIAKSMEPQTSAKPITRGSLSQMMGDQLEKGLGASPPLKPNVPLRGQISTTMKEAAPQLPEGHTAVDSTAIRSYKYDPQTQEFEAWPTSGDTAYRYGEVSPDAAKAFQDAPSKGKAFQQIKNSGTLVAKRVNGKWVSVKPARGSIAEGMK